MAPEVFMKSNSEGHGRAADIWSIGCVIIEMASGKVYVISKTYASRFYKNIVLFMFVETLV